MSNKNGFTLIELIIVIAIMGVILAVVSSMFFFSNETFGKTSDQQAVQSDVRLISTLIEDELQYAHELEVLDTISAPLEATKRYIYLEDDKIMIKAENESASEILSAFDFIEYSLTFEKYNSTVLNYQLSGSFDDNIFSVESDIEVLNMSGLSSNESIQGSSGIGVKYTIANDKNSFVEFKFISEKNLDDDGNPILNNDYFGIISNEIIYVHLPSDVDFSDLIPSFKTDGSSVEVDGNLQESGVTSQDFTSTVTYTIIAENGETKDYKVHVKPFK